MYEKCPVKLNMVRSILRDGIFDEDEREAEVIRYDEETELLYLSVESYDLPEYSLDAIYECRIEAEEEVACLGVVKERYQNGDGYIIKFKIQNGFYKKLVN